MNTDVLNYLLAIEKYGSLNKASAHLYISQPNLTNIINSFEQQLGYKVLNRNHNGVSFTNQGQQLLIIAREILDKQQQIIDIKNNQQIINLNISIGNNYDVFKALFKSINFTLLQQYHLTIKNLPVRESLESVYKQESNICYIIIPLNQDKLIKEYCKLHDLVPYFFKEQYCYICMSKKHPLANKLNNYDQLWDYPLIDYMQQQDNPYGILQKYINPSKTILIDNIHLRNEALLLTDGYAITMQNNPKNKLLLYHKIEQLKMHLVEIRRNVDINNSLYNNIRDNLFTN